jgi:hypothetical protein
MKSTNQPNVWRNRFAYAVGVIVILLGLLVWMFFENGKNQESASLDRGRLIAGKKASDSIAARWERLADSTHTEWVKSDKRHKHEMDSSSKARKPLIVRERSQRPNPETLTLVDTIYASFEEDLTKAKEQREIDSLSHAKEVETLKQSKLAIKTYADSTFLQLLTTNDNLIKVEKKLSKMEKLAAWLGVSTATLAVVVTILAIAL